MAMKNRKREICTSLETLSKFYFITLGGAKENEIGIVRCKKCSNAYRLLRKDNGIQGILGLLNHAYSHED
jgi:hypothetical protein